MSDDLLTPAEVAGQCKCHPKTVMRAYEAKELEGVPIGKRGPVRFRQAWVDTWIDEKAERRRRSLRLVEPTPIHDDPPAARPARRRAAGSVGAGRVKVADWMGR